MKTFLHVGCGLMTKAGLKGFNAEEWKEIRFDIDPGVNPDIQGTMTDMRAIAPESVDAVYSSHNIEHLYPHEAPIALKNFHRVLKEDGFLVLTCPDLQTVSEHVANRGLHEPLYMSPAGPIAPIDILYGHRQSLARGNLYMAHKCGFTYASLHQCVTQAGFAGTCGGSRKGAFDLWILASRQKLSPPDLRRLASLYLP